MDLRGEKDMVKRSRRPKPRRPKKRSGTLSEGFRVEKGELIMEDIFSLRKKRKK